MASLLKSGNKVSAHVMSSVDFRYAMSSISAIPRPELAYAMPSPVLTYAIPGTDKRETMSTS
eukprot:2663088-Rhodomonas_salina.7